MLSMVKVVRGWEKLFTQPYKLTLKMYNQKRAYAHTYTHSHPSGFAALLCPFLSFTSPSLLTKQQRLLYLLVHIITILYSLFETLVVINQQQLSFCLCQAKQNCAELEILTYQNFFILLKASVAGVEIFTSLDLCRKSSDTKNCL